MSGPRERLVSFRTATGGKISIFVDCDTHIFCLLLRQANERRPGVRDLETKFVDIVTQIALASGTHQPAVCGSCGESLRPAVPYSAVVMVPVDPRLDQHISFGVCRVCAVSEAEVQAKALEILGSIWKCRFVRTTHDAPESVQ
jgi:hypothetical protein